MKRRILYPRTLFVLLAVLLDETTKDFNQAITEQEKAQEFLIKHNFIKEEKGDLVVTEAGKNLLRHKLSDGISFKNILKMSTSAKIALVKEILKSDSAVAEALAP